MISYTELDHDNEDINKIAKLIDEAMDEIVDPNDFMVERVAKYLIEHGVYVKHG